MIQSIRSGAQTGADQGGLDAALALSLQPGGWVPRGRKTDAGPLTDEQMRKWNLREHVSSSYAARTEQNAREADVTVWFGNTTSPGYKCTRNACIRWNTPMHCNPVAMLLRELAKSYPIWNVAGNRERTNPGIYQRTLTAIVTALGPHATGRWCWRCEGPLTEADIEAKHCTQCRVVIL
jgi:hypothetical protein